MTRDEIAGAPLAVRSRMQSVGSKSAELSLLDRPRERILRRGTASIGDAELVALVLGSGRKALEVADAAMRSAGGIGGLSRSTVRELARVPGVGVAHARRIVAAFELGRRAVEAVTYRTAVAAPEDVYRLIAPRLAGVSQELFLVVGFDIRQGVLDIVEVARGSATAVEVHPREVFRPLVRMAASGGVLVHNHPSGDPTPSDDDLDLTRRLREVGLLLGIPIIDHIVVGAGSYRSIAQLVYPEP